jgi:hypothetical protein
LAQFAKQAETTVESGDVMQNPKDHDHIEIEASKYRAETRFQNIDSLKPGVRI